MKTGKNRQTGNQNPFNPQSSGQGGPYGNAGGTPFGGGMGNAGEHRSAVAPEVLEAAHSEAEWEMPEEHHLAVAPGNTMDSLDTMECHR